MSMNTARIIILEGNICAGKTSLSRDLGRMLNYHVFLEPMVTNPYLEKFYADPRKYALPMQLWLLKQRFKTYVSAVQFVLHNGRGVILDRSIFSDWVFAEKNRKDGNITEDGYHQYSAQRKKYLHNLPIPQITLYLDVSPQECYKRIHTLRCRDFESGIPLEYLSGLDTCYNSFLKMMEDGGSAVVRIPWNTFGDSAQIADIVRAKDRVLPALDQCVNISQLNEHVARTTLMLSMADENDTSNHGGGANSTHATLSSTGDDVITLERVRAEQEAQESEARASQSAPISPAKILVNCN